MQMQVLTGICTQSLQAIKQPSIKKIDGSTFASEQTLSCRKNRKMHKQAESINSIKNINKQLINNALASFEMDQSHSILIAEVDLL